MLFRSRNVDVEETITLTTQVQTGYNNVTHEGKSNQWPTQPVWTVPSSYPTEKMYIGYEFKEGGSSSGVSASNIDLWFNTTSGNPTVTLNSNTHIVTTFISKFNDVQTTVNIDGVDVTIRMGYLGGQYSNDRGWLSITPPTPVRKIRIRQNSGAFHTHGDNNNAYRKGFVSVVQEPVITPFTSTITSGDYFVHDIVKQLETM